MNIKLVIHWGGLGEMGELLIYSWICNYSIYLDIQAYYLDIQAISTHPCLLLVLDVFPSIDSFFYNITALLKSDVFVTVKKKLLNIKDVEFDFRVGCILV